jgi:hypothetical protein
MPPARWRTVTLVIALAALILTGRPAPAIAQSRPSAAPAPTRRVLVELFTSQGCDMCPEAEDLLGRLARDHRATIVPVALHVDYFDEPWKDVFSDPQHSRRQMTYNAAYKKPKPAEYGLYYTPMLMIDGEQSVNGRDAAAASAAIAQAAKQPPLVAIAPDLVPHSGGRSAELRVDVTATSPRVRGRELVVGVIVREDGIETKVERGENRGKALIARFPSRKTMFDFTTPPAPGKPRPPSLRFDLELAEGAKPENTAVVLFVQDRTSGHVFQAAEVPWPSATTTPQAGDATAGPSR